MKQIYNITQAAKLLNRTTKCLQQWDRNKKLIAFRTKTNRRYYTEEQLNNFINNKNIISQPKCKIAYCRVSSNSQKPDLKNQRNILEQYCISKGYANVEFIEEIGGGLNFNRKYFNQIINDIINGKISHLLLAHKDRFCRFGFELIQNLCTTYNCELEIINSEKLSPEQEMVNDLMTIIHCFSSRLYGLRNYKKSLKLSLKNASNS
jgi:predicted site-specific integrase-resolvase